MVDANVDTESPRACDVATMTDTVIGDDENYAEYEQPCEYYAQTAEFPGWCEYYAYVEHAAYAYPYSAKTAEWCYVTARW
jgi:hypothetical protein